MSSVIELKATLDSLTQQMGSLARRQADSELLLHTIHSKLDMQGQRMSRLEVEVKQELGSLTTELREQFADKADYKANTVKVSLDSDPQPSKAASAAVSETGDFENLNSKPELLSYDSHAVNTILEAMNKNLKEVKDCVHKVAADVEKTVSEKMIQPIQVIPANETTEIVSPQLDEPSISNHNIIIKLREIEGRLQDGLCDLGSHLKAASSSLEGVEGGMQAVQNVVNKFSATLTQVKDKCVSKEEVKKCKDKCVSKKEVTDVLKEYKDNCVSREELKQVLKECNENVQIAGIEKKIEEVNKNCKLILEKSANVEVGYTEDYWD